MLSLSFGSRGNFLLLWVFTDELSPSYAFSIVLTVLPLALEPFGLLNPLGLLKSSCLLLSGLLKLANPMPDIYLYLFGFRGVLGV